MTVRPTPSGQTPGPGIARTGKPSSPSAPVRPDATPAPAPAAPAAKQQDGVTISPQGRELQQRDAGGASASGELSAERLQEVLGRISSGYYDQPQIQAAVVSRLARDL